MLKTLCAALVVVLSLQAAAAFAQAPNVATRESTTTATVEKVEKSIRVVTLRGDGNTILSIYADPSIKAFDALKVGDVVRVRYLESVVVQVRRDAKLVDVRDSTDEAKTTNSDVIHQLRAVVRIEDIDSQGLTVTYRTSDGRKMMHVVQDKKLLDGLHVGDRIEVTLTRERALSINPAR
jgi:Cu/Ag efflux protein CusF